MRKKTFPKKMVILGRKFKISVVNKTKLCTITTPDAVACVDFSDNHVYIWDELSDEQKMLSLFHELSHICHVTVGLDQVISDELQEILCETMANAFGDLLKSFHK